LALEREPERVLALELGRVLVLELVLEPERVLVLVLEQVLGLEQGWGLAPLRMTQLAE
jgi:hypothetical protein